MNFVCYVDICRLIRSVPRYLLHAVSNNTCGQLQAPKTSLKLLRDNKQKVVGAARNARALKVFQTFT